MVWFLSFYTKPILVKTHRIISILLLSFILIHSSCRKSDVVVDNPGTPGNNGGLNEALILQIVNNQRLQGCDCGSVYYPPAAAVTWNNQLEAAATAHAADMNQYNYFSHTGRDGSSPGDRIRDAGYDWFTYGENIAKGHPDEQAVVTAWINSEGHCKNIMNPSFREMGVSKVGPYWVQEFGAR